MTDVRSKRGADDENAGSTKAKPDKSDKSGTPDPAKSDTAKPDTSKSDAAKPDTEQPESESDLPPKTEESEAAESDTGRRDEDEDDEDTEELRRRYLLRRFWHTAIRFWTTPDHRIAWMLSGAAARYHPAQSRGVLRDEPLESQHLRCAGEEGRPAPSCMLSMIYFVDSGRQRLFQRRPGLRPHDAAAALAQMAHGHPGGPVAEVRALLSAQPGQRRSPEPGIPHRRRRPDRDRVAGRFRQRRYVGISVGGHLHRGALDDRRRAELQPRRHGDLYPRLPGDRGGALRGDRQRRDDADRPPFRSRLRGQEPVRGRIALRAHAPARERREHRAHPRRRGGARGRRPRARQGAAVMALDLRSVHEDDDGIEHLRLHRAGAADHPVRAEIPRRFDDARRR